MATKTTKPKAAGKTRRKQTPKRPPKSQSIGATDIPIDQIVASPFQPRRDFDAAELDALARSIEAHGLLQPILARTALDIHGDGRIEFLYELVDGERRWRAAKKLGLKTIRAEVGKQSDAQVRAIVLASALQRADLNPLEEARAFRQMLDAGDAKGPTALAKLLGLSQGQVSNRLRLLELPDDWQARIISREIPATHAREVLRYKDHPQLLAAIGKELRSNDQNHQTVAEFTYAVEYAVETATRPLDGRKWQHPKRGLEDLFEPTAAERKKLGVVTIGTGPGKENRAANVELWDKLQAASLKPSGNGSANKAGKEKPPAAANGKAKSSPGPKAVIDPQKLWDWYIRWQRWLIAETCRGRCSGITEGDTLLFLLELRGELDNRGHHDTYWSAAFRACEIKLQRSGTPKTIDILKSLANESPTDLFDIAGNFLASMFFDQSDGPVATIADDRVLAIVKTCDISIESDWGFQQAGPLTEEYWAMHSKDELVALAAELDVPIKPAGSQAAMVKAFMAKIQPEDSTEIGLDYPRELKRIKPPKR